MNPLFSVSPLSSLSLSLFLLLLSLPPSLLPSSLSLSSPGLISPLPLLLPPALAELMWLGCGALGCQNFED